MHVQLESIRWQELLTIRPSLIAGVIRLWSLLKLVVRVWNLYPVLEYFFSLKNKHPPLHFRFLLALQISSWSIGRDNTENALLTREFFLILKEQNVSLTKFFFHKIFCDARFMFLPVYYLPCVYCFSAVQKFIWNIDVRVIRMSEGSSRYPLKQVRFVSVCSSFLSLNVKLYFNQN